MSTRDKSCFLLKTKLKALERLHIKQVIKRKAIGLDVGKTYKKMFEFIEKYTLSRLNHKEIKKKM